jgi:hypothetical protein
MLRISQDMLPLTAYVLNDAGLLSEIPMHWEHSIRAASCVHGQYSCSIPRVQTSNSQGSSRDGPLIKQLGDRRITVDSMDKTELSRLNLHNLPLLTAPMLQSSNNTWDGC